MQQFFLGNQRQISCQVVRVVGWWMIYFLVVMCRSLVWASTGEVVPATGVTGTTHSQSASGSDSSTPLADPLRCALIVSGYDATVSVDSATSCEQSLYTYQWTFDGASLPGSSDPCTTTVTTGGHLHVDVLSGDTIACADSVDVESLSPDTTDPVDDWQLLITEVHPKNDTHPEYIELLLTGSYDGEVRVDGLGRGRAAKSIDLTGIAPGYIIVTDSVFLSETQLHGATVRKLSSISLTDGGQSLTLRTADNTLQTLSYPTATIDKSMYPSTTDPTLFSEIGLPTPGLVYTSPSDGSDPSDGDDQGADSPDSATGSGGFDFVDPACAIARQHTAPVPQGKKINLITKRAGVSIQNSSRSYRCQIDMGDDTRYDVCNPNYHTYAAAGLYVVRAIIRRGEEVCYASTVVNYPTSSSPSSRSTSSSSSYRDRYDTLLQQIAESGYRRHDKKIIPINDEQMRDRLAMTGVIAIDALMPDAVGVDTNQEGLRLTNMTGTSYDLSGSYLLVGSSKKRLAGVIDPQTSQTFVQTRGLRNSAGCVYLMSADDILLDQFCYTSTTAGEWIEQSDVRYHVDPRVQRIGLSLHDDVGHQQVCLQYGDSDTALACQPYAAMQSVLTGQHLSGQTGYVDRLADQSISTGQMYQCLDMSSLSTDELFTRLLPYVAGSGNVSIVSLLPNPDGADKDAEAISFRSTHALSDTISLSGYTIRSGKKITRLSGDLVVRSTDETIWTGSLGLKNSANCVYLFDDHGRLEDQFCYDRAPSGVTLSGSVHAREGHPLFVWSDLAVVQADDEVCVMYGAQRMRCVAGYDSAKVDKQLASYEKKATRAQQKYEKQQEKYAQCMVKRKELDTEDKRQRKAIRERVAKQQKKNSARLKRYNERNKKLAAQMREQRATNRLLDDYIDSMAYQFRDEAYDAGEYDKALRRTDVYKTIDTQISSGAETYTYGWVDVDIDDVDSVYTLYAIEHDLVGPLQDMFAGDASDDAALYHSAGGDHDA